MKERKKENHFREATGKRVRKSQHTSVTANIMRKSLCLENVEWEAAYHTQETSVYRQPESVTRI